MPEFSIPNSFGTFCLLCANGADGVGNLTTYISGLQGDCVDHNVRRCHPIPVHEGNKKKNTSDFHSNNNSSERKMAGRKPYVRAQQTTITTKRAELQVHSFRTSLWLTFTHIRKCSDWIQAASYFHTKTSTHTYFAQYTMRVARCWFSQPNQNLGQPEMIEAMCLF